VKITFLGTGTSQGVPVIGCHCVVCKSDNPQDQRLRSSLLIQTANTNVIIDTGPDFRQQMLQHQVQQLQAVVYTHHHKDHVAGLDDIRAFNYKQNEKIDVYATEQTQKGLAKEFSYIFDGTNYPGIPQLKIHTIDTDSFWIGDLHFTPIHVLHYKMPVLGFIVNDLFTYITDANFIATEEIQKFIHTPYLVLNALRKETHISHFTLEEAIAISQLTESNQTYFTHISHQLGLHHSINQELPTGIALAYDGLVLNL
jgi:phosphoribosyl 1,2-cyclic phosphate phosphodiesterase